MTNPFLSYLEFSRPQILATIRRLVEMESPSSNKTACDALAAHLAGEFERVGGRAKVHRQTDSGNHLTVEFKGKSRGAKPILLLGHFDTVWEIGTLKTMPWKEEKGRAHGPGIFDMKTGVAMMLYALEALQHNGGLPRPVIVQLVSDEEVGSMSSRAITEKMAKQCAAVLVLEPSAGPNGACKTARKGVGSYSVKVKGVSAHAGLDPTKGASAIHELSRQIVRISDFGELDRGLTVNVGVIRGGTRNNVVAAEAEADVDVRIAKMSDASRIARKFRSLKAVDKRCKLEVEGGINRPPLERSKGVAALYKSARTIASGLGYALEETAVGGGSDGNFTAGMGIPTLDGLGAVGDGAHATHEHILVAELPRRTALIAELIRQV